MSACLNCGAPLTGAFCAACGQRSVPANPTVRELAGDTWSELTGYDGRIASTFRALLQPGRLTTEYIQGRRARYLPPVRLYLIVSVLYFLVSAAAPATETRSGDERDGTGGLRIGVTGGAGTATPMSPEERAAALRDLDDSPRWIRPMLRSMIEDPTAFRARIFTIMPRVFFGLLPVFAGIVALFYRGRRFPTALVFAAHIHAFAFLVFSLTEGAKFMGVPMLETMVGLIVAIGFVVYALKALRSVFGGGWPITLGKGIAISFVYLLASVPAFMIILIWASVV